MALTAVRCKRCAKIFPSDLETCPSCGRMGPEGWRNILLKTLAVLAFLLALALIGYVTLRSQEGF